MKNSPKMYLNLLITLYKPPVCSNTTNQYKTNFQRHKYRVLQVFKSNRVLFITSNEKCTFIFKRNKKKKKKTPNMCLNHLITSCKPPAYSNSTTHHKTYFQYHKYRILKYLN